MFPNSQRINRGGYDIKQMMKACVANNVTDLIILTEHGGIPGDVMIFWTLWIIYIFVLNSLLCIVRITLSNDEI